MGGAHQIQELWWVNDRTKLQIYLRVHPELEFSDQVS